MPGVPYTDLDELLLQNDDVSLHLSLDDATRNLLNRDDLYQMKKRAARFLCGRWKKKQMQ